MELTITYNIEVTEVIKDPELIAAIMADTEEVESMLRDDSDDFCDDLHVYGLKLFYNEGAAE